MDEGGGENGKRVDEKGKEGLGEGEVEREMMVGGRKSVGDRGMGEREKRWREVRGNEREGKGK